jgi:hypothetical protein
MSTFLHFNTKTDANGDTIMDEQVRDITVDLPAGFYGNPQAMATCTMQDIIDSDGFCQPAAQVGVLNYEISTGFFLDFPVYNLNSPDSQTAELAVVAVGVPAKIVVSVRSDGNYGLQAKLTDLNQALALTTTRLTLWGVPADPVHDPDRFFPGQGLFGKGAPAGVPQRPFLSMPSRCEPVTTTLRASSWQNPDKVVAASVTSPTLTGCDQLKFNASIKARPQVTAAGAPSGFDVRLSVPQDESVKGLATPQLRKAVVTLPVGTTVSAASADGLGACSDADLKIGTSEQPNCPESSKVGTVSIDTPVLEDPVAGDIILGTQRPDQLLRFWFVVRGPGLLLKIPGKVDPDLVTGQLVATLDGTPQLPFTNLDTSFKGGPHAALVNPKACGTYTTHATLSPWSGGAPVDVQDSFTIDENCDQAGRFEPTLDAGTADPAAGGSSPVVLNLSRPSGNVTPPKVAKKLTLSKLTSAQRSALARTGKVALTVRVTGGGTVSLRSRGRIAGSTKTLGTGRKVVLKKAATSVKVTFTLSSAARRELSRRHRLSMTLEARLTGVSKAVTANVGLTRALR